MTDLANIAPRHRINYAALLEREARLPHLAYLLDEAVWGGLTDTTVADWLADYGLANTPTNIREGRRAIALALLDGN